MSARLKARLLGRFEIACDDKVVEIGSRKLRALAGYLAATHPRRQPREAVMTLLWGSHFDKQARQNLRQALVRLKQALGTEALVIDDESLGFADDTLDTDLAAVRQALKDRSLPALRAIGDLASPELLSGLAVPEDGWTEWLETERRRVRRQLVDALTLLGERELAGGEAEAALAAGERALEFDSAREDAFRVLFQALVSLGRGADATARFARFEARLRDEFGAEPSAETRRAVSAPAPVSDLPAPPLDYARPPAIPDGVSLAVLPFHNISGDERGAIIAAGVVEDIVTTLAKISHILVVARQSTAGYVGADADPTRVSREQGVRHVLQGAVRMAGDRIRVTTHLCDAIDGHELWAERFDRQFSDLLEIQDEITKEVVSALQVELTDGEQARAWARGTRSPVAWENIVVATELIHAHRRDGVARARRLAEDAIRLDPEFAAAWAALGWTHWVEGRWGWADPPRSFEIARQHARRGLDLDPDNADALSLSGMCAVHVGDYDDAIQTMEKALLNAPGHAHLAALTAYVHRYGGDPARAVACMRRAIRLSPIHPPWYLASMAGPLWKLGHKDEALACLREAVGRDPEFAPGLAMLAAHLALADRVDEARAVVASLLNLEPGFSARHWNDHNPWREPADRALMQTGLHKAGAPA